MPAQSSDDVHAAVNKAIQGVSALAFKKLDGVEHRAKNEMSADKAGVCFMFFLDLIIIDVNGLFRKVGINVTAITMYGWSNGGMEHVLPEPTRLD